MLRIAKCVGAAVGIALAALVARPAYGQTGAAAKNEWNITKNTTLKPQTYDLADRKSEGAIRISKNDVTLDGHGALIDGGGEGGFGIVVENGSNITIKNLTIKGYKIGIRISGGGPVRLDDVDASDNYEGSSAGAPSDQRAGGILLENVSTCALVQVRASRGWNGIMMMRCAHVDLSQCETIDCHNHGIYFSRTRDSNARECKIQNCSRAAGGWGAGVVFDDGCVRDSVANCTITRCGSGVVMRARGTLMNERIVLAGNEIADCRDCAVDAKAFTPGIEANKIHNCPQGVILRSCDEARVAENNIYEIGEKGGASADSAAVLLLGGSHVNFSDNTIKNAAGPGISICGGNGEAVCRQLIVVANKISGCGAGIALEQASLIDIRSNWIHDNTEKRPIIQKNGVADLTFQDCQSDVGHMPVPIYIDSPAESIVAGETIKLKAGYFSKYLKGKLSWRWDFGDGSNAEGQPIEHKFRNPGLYSICVFGGNDATVALAYYDLAVVAPGPEFTEGAAGRFGVAATSGKTPKLSSDSNVKIKGGTSLHLEADGESDIKLVFPKLRDAAWDLTNKKSLHIWVRCASPDGAAPSGPPRAVRLVDEHPKSGVVSYLEFKPRESTGASGGFRSARHRAFDFYEIPFAGNAQWSMETIGAPSLASMDAIEMDFQSAAAGYEFWIDGLQFIK
ncbi:MAG: right-handed parallel beta-helix repeat-containing protein [Planctomycetes bacterium]|nr:right-handed parallel beta-helix repeat-containing protein [Planctomycetota bacterium]